MWRVVGVGVGLLRHDREVEGVVVKDDAVLELCVRGRACYSQAHIPKRRSHRRISFHMEEYSVKWSSTKRSRVKQ